MVIFQNAGYRMRRLADVGVCVDQAVQVHAHQLCDHGHRGVRDQHADLLPDGPEKEQKGGSAQVLYG